jgi:3-deoxy-manno-octulosonate cytidylyltransferase (CMP-KDO synthetase)
MTKNLIIIPARYASTRLPAKPLAMIAGQTMLGRVVNIANAASIVEDCAVVVATDHLIIANHCSELGVDYVMTDEACQSGTDRCAQTLTKLSYVPDFVVNLQGDAPLTPPDFVASMINAYWASPADVMTLVTRLTWQELDLMRAQKQQTPFSGTTVALRESDGSKLGGLALWFSKQIIPAIRGEEKLRSMQAHSPIWRHIGIYGYSSAMLATYATMHESYYEQLEGLEQLRLLENGYSIRCVAVDYANRASMSGVDSAQDVLRAEALIAKHGELLEPVANSTSASCE